MSRPWLVLLSAPPGSLKAREQLDLALACLACELPLAVLFCGPGVQLLHPRRAAVPPVARALAQLADFGCQQSYACSQALAARGLLAAEAAIAVQPLDAQAQSRLLRTVHGVLGD